MPTLKTRIILWLIRNRQIFKFKFGRNYFDPKPEAIIKLRKDTEKAGLKFGKIPSDIAIKPTNIGNMYAEWVCLSNAPKEKAILYFHGGMYLIGSPQGHRVHVSKFVMGTGVNALVFDYRLAPENPFPAGLNDAVEAYQFLLSGKYLPENILFIGDSAGAGLCLATLLALKDKNIPLPAAAAVLSPWTDLTLSGASYSLNKFRCVSPLGSSESASEYYTGTADRKNPYISPLFGDLHGLPPLHISAGSNEILLDDSVQFAKKASESGVEVTLTVGEGMCHCYPAFGSIFPESAATLNEICEFLKKQITQ